MTRFDRDPHFGTSSPAVVALILPVQAIWSRPIDRAAPRAAFRPGRSRWIRRALDTVLTWQQRARERSQLMQLSDHLLRDIGVSRAMAAGEAEKPFWRV